MYWKIIARYLQIEADGDSKEDKIQSVLQCSHVARQVAEQRSLQLYCYSVVSIWVSGSTDIFLFKELGIMKKMVFCQFPLDVWLAIC